jgi:hypothetical protein
MYQSSVDLDNKCHECHHFDLDNKYHEYYLFDFVDK